MKLQTDQNKSSLFDNIFLCLALKKYTININHLISSVYGVLYEAVCSANEDKS